VLTTQRITQVVVFSSWISSASSSSASF
jgi:hypothetical protein